MAFARSASSGNGRRTGNGFRVIERNGDSAARVSVSECTEQSATIAGL